MDEEKKYGILSCTTTNTEESMEGSHSCIVGIMEALMELESRGAEIVKAQLDIKFLDPGLEFTTEGKTVDIGNCSVFIDNISLERIRRFDEISEDSRKNAFKLLMKHEWDWMTKDQYKEFASEFLGLYCKIDGMPRFDLKEDFDLDFIEDLNKCLGALSNNHYRIRRGGMLAYPYQLVYGEKEVGE